ncbi:hypothetical protein GGR42_000271 [Saonia flava]|uniref:Uncharacterized protein n=1 Tax=Saonia flava TaxID=523696 RepID=A0A846QYW7_9FLAO|nr:hypothetical protein [Saonia flava]NJB69809.1 hypothetical protein [Saonia flava]
MNHLLRIFSWKRSMLLSICVLCILIVLNFYGVYTNKFYFLRPDNYIFPILTIVHFVYIYVIQFKIREMERPDIQMRNLEYSLYIILFVYLFKLYESVNKLLSYTDFKDHLLPDSFKPMSMLILYLYILLLFLTFLTFKHRKDLVGNYVFDDKDGIDSWE